jgi:hypothetical protein
VRHLDPWLAFLVSVLTSGLLAILLGGCSQTQERSVRIREGIEQGKPTRWIEREQSESKTQVVDPQAIGAAVAEAVKTAVPGADVLVAALKAAVPTEDSLAKAFRAATPPPRETDWTQIGAAAGGLATVATTGYLAFKKREQLKKG